MLKKVLQVKNQTMNTFWYGKWKMNNACVFVYNIFFIVYCKCI